MINKILCTLLASTGLLFASTQVHLDKPIHTAEQVEAIKNQTVLIMTESGMGSGVGLVGGYVLTAYHVVHDKANSFRTDAPWLPVSHIEIQTYSEQRTQNVTLIYASPDHDLALLYSPDLEFVGVKTAGNKPMGEKVAILGNGGYDWFDYNTATMGRFFRDWSDDLWNQTFRYISPSGQPGDSGCGVWDAAGRLNGILVGGLYFDKDHKHTIIVPYITMRDFLDQATARMTNQLPVDP